MSSNSNWDSSIGSSNAGSTAVVSEEETRVELSKAGCGTDGEVPDRDDDAVVGGLRSGCWILVLARSICKKNSHFAFSDRENEKLRSVQTNFSPNFECKMRMRIHFQN